MPLFKFQRRRSNESFRISYEMRVRKQIGINENDENGQFKNLNVDRNRLGCRRQLAIRARKNF